MSTGRSPRVKLKELRQNLLCQALLPNTFLSKVFAGGDQKKIGDIFIAEMEGLFDSNESLREKFKQKNATLYYSLMHSEGELQTTLVPVASHSSLGAYPRLHASCAPAVLAPSAPRERLNYGL